MIWLDYYKQEFLKTFDKTNKLRKSDTNEDIMCAQYIEMFNSACTLIKMYLNYNGLFQFEPREVIKEAFYVELIEDGERWINALSLAEVYETGEKEFNSLILSYCEDENFVIYEHLKDKFKNYEEEYEKAS